MVLDFLKSLWSKVVSTVNFVMGPWMRDPDQSIPLFNALIGYSLMLTCGCLSKTLLAKVLTWGALAVWTIARSFKLSDVMQPITAAKTKLPVLLSYHAGAAAAFFLSSL